MGEGRAALAGITLVALTIGCVPTDKVTGPESYSSHEPPPVGSGPPYYDFWTYTQLEPMSERQINAYCKMSEAEWEEHYESRDAEARAISDRLEAYIRDWLAGRAPARLPEGLLPPSIDNPKTKDWTLMRPDQVVPEDQWGIRYAHEIPEDFSKLHFLGPDNHVTYLETIFIAPFGAELIVEGEFPHARFMDFQILEPFDPRNSTTAGFGAPEVPIVDVDIDPDPGHVNPFRAKADRNATKRGYHVTFGLEAGNALELNPVAMRVPAYRAPGNRRVGGPFGASGPIGDGRIIPSTLWLRYYASDRAAGPLGGVRVPKMLLRLKTGETFWLQADFSLAIERGTWSVPGLKTDAVEPPALLGPTVGWGKMWGFWLTFADGIAYPLTRPWGLMPKSWVSGWIKKRHKCLFGRGPEMPPPGNHELSASGCNYISYLYRVMMLGEEKVYVLRGKLPRTPRTRDGEPVATTAEARYWSVCHTGNGEGKRYPSLLYGCLMDDEVTVNGKGEYLIVYSRGGARPANARRECGITWQDFGLESQQAFSVRWMSVIPEDHLPSAAPHLDNLPYKTSEWSEPGWDPDLLSRNSHDGFMGPYQPVVHYLSRSTFEKLGCPIEPRSIPAWEEGR